ncbi:hypothetical protein HU200_029089 [Digitaria exilis]|uniref:Uncharacterized protein n=1 Tax=Digitaria exilis TaxID=1010633 RepID=A0A835EP84_9POAL|nr:hypothetical protein HU200_029089 [Digitaria exilis]
MARNRRHRGLRKLATLLVCKDTLDQLWSMEPCRSSSDITSLVYNHVQDVATNINFNDSRGQRTLEHEQHRELLVHIDKPFDEAMLMTGTRSSLFKTAYDDRKNVMGDHKKYHGESCPGRPRWSRWGCVRTANALRGYLHAKSLGKGGEYLSHVWLLLSLMGMETLAERLQRTEKPARPRGQESNDLIAYLEAPRCGLEVRNEVVRRRQTCSDAVATA